MDFTLQSAFLAEMSTLLILLAGAILLYGCFREKYLVPWIAGWCVFTFSKISLLLSSSQSPDPVWKALAYCSYVVAIALFVTAVFLYVAQHRLILPSLTALSAALALELAHTLWRPYPALHYAAFALCWLVSILASAQLVRFAWGR